MQPYVILGHPPNLAVETKAELSHGQCHPYYPLPPNRQTLFSAHGPLFPYPGTGVHSYPIKYYIVLKYYSYSYYYLSQRYNFPLGSLQKSNLAIAMATKQMIINNFIFISLNNLKLIITQTHEDSLKYLKLG